MGFLPLPTGGIVLRCGGRDSNPRKPKLEDLESCPFGHSGTPARNNTNIKPIINRYPEKPKPPHGTIHVMKLAISLGGSLLTGKNTDSYIQLEHQTYKKYAQTLKEIHNQGHQIIVVCGGGKPARYFINTAKKLDAANHIQDTIGIKCTHINALLLTAALGPVADQSTIYQQPHQIEKAPPDKILVGGGYRPGTSTDYRTVQFAQKIDADLIINATDVDGVYTKNPARHNDAVKLKTLTYARLEEIIQENTRQLPGEYGLFDLKATRLAKKISIPTIIIDGSDPMEIKRATDGTHHGSIISE
jgi:uridylate kinase